MNYLKLMGLAAVIGAAVWLHGVLADRAEFKARAEAAEARNVELAEANASLVAAGKRCTQAAETQSYAAVAAMARREELAEIMAGPGTAAGESGELKGDKLNEAQDRLLVDFYNNLFTGLGSLRAD